MPIPTIGLGFLLGLLVLGHALAGQTPTSGRAVVMKPTLKINAQGENRVALVIGNAAYKDAPLKNPVNDARAMANAIKACGFTVTRLENATRVQMREAIRTFGSQIGQGGIGLFYYAGHGMQVKGRNYLIPVGADIAQEDEVESEAVEVDAVLAKMETARNRLNIVILDACRNNPFGRSFRGRQQGLAQMDAPTGTYVAFATAPGRTAADGSGANGLYTRALLDYLQLPGLKLEEVFKRARAEVLQASGQEQTPWENSSIVGDFFFVPGNAAPAGVPASGTRLPPPPVAAAQVGGLQVSVNAAEAQVYVDGAMRGTASPTSALNVEDLPVGTVSLRVEAPGHVPQEQNIEIQQGQWTQVKLVLARTASPVPAPPAQAAAWKAYTYPAEGFRVDCPADPNLNKQRLPTPIGDFELRNYVSSFASRAYVVGVCDYGKKMAGTDPDAVLQAAKRGSLPSTQSHLLNEHKIKLNVSPGLEYESESDTLHYRWRLFYVGTTLYTVVLISPIGDPDNDPARFLDSFGLIARVPG